MATNPETQALLEKALHHVLAEQAKVLKHSHRNFLIGAAQELGDLAAETWKLLSQGFHKIHSTENLTKHARKIEQAIDDISEQIWVFIDVSVSSIYEKVEQSFTVQPIQEKLKLKAAIAVRNHFHNIRLLLLEQLLSARMLINNNDYGSEIERVWQQFFQRELGSDFRILQGGHIIDYEGNNANAQIDLLVVPADAHVMSASNSDGSKVNVLCDQVIAAVMTTSNLTVKKIGDDWEKLRRVSELFKFTDEIPHAFPANVAQAWPLCYIIAGQADPLASLSKEWVTLASAMPTSTFVPQLLIALDSGYLYSGATSWPRPRYPTDWVKTTEVKTEDDIYAGLGIAWLLTQVRARAKLLQNKPVQTIQRFTKLLDNATLKSGTPATWSPRFSTWFSSKPIEGVFHWGHTSGYFHNRLHLSSVYIRLPQDTLPRNLYVNKEGINPMELPWDKRDQYLRWFHHNIHISANGHIALQEWIKNVGNSAYSPSYAFFNSVTGEEIKLEETLGNVDFEEAKRILNSLYPGAENPKGNDENNMSGSE